MKTEGVPGVVYTLQANGIDRADTAGCNGCGFSDGGVSYTLNTVDRHAVCYAPKANYCGDFEEAEVSATLTTGYCHGSGGDAAVVCCGLSREAIAGNMNAGGISLNFTPPVLYENHATDSRITGPHTTAPTVVARFGTGGGQHTARRFRTQAPENGGRA